MGEEALFVNCTHAGHAGLQRQLREAQMMWRAYRDLATLYAGFQDLNVELHCKLREAQEAGRVLSGKLLDAVTLGEQFKAERDAAIERVALEKEEREAAVGQSHINFTAYQQADERALRNRRWAIGAWRRAEAAEALIRKCPTCGLKSDIRDGPAEAQKGCDDA